MLKKIDSEKYQFSTGRFITPNCDIIGINDELNLYEGYDTSMDAKIVDPDDTDDTIPDFESEQGVELTPVEKHELAQYMISLWSKLLLQEPQY